jgi:ferritin-like metal-binding protein YciE
LEIVMPNTSTKDLVVSGLNELRQGMERSRKIYEELGRAAQNPRIKEALDARGLISAQNLRRLDECFRLLGEDPVEANPREFELFIEDLREELEEIEAPNARTLFVLDKASRLGQMHEAVYDHLIEAADALGYPAISLLLESCLADRRVFAERTKRLIRQSSEQRCSAGRSGGT